MSKKENHIKELFLTGLIDSMHRRTYSGRHAAVYGITKARIIAQIHYWSEVKVKMGEDPDHEGYIWFYHTDADFKHDFMDLKQRCIQKNLSDLVKMGIIKLRYETAGEKRKSRYIAMDYPAFKKHFQSNWLKFMENADFKIVDEGGSMEDEKFYIPYSINFDHHSLFIAAQNAADNGVTGGFGRTKCGTTLNIQRLTMICYSYIMATFKKNIVKHTQYNNEDDLPVQGKFSFDVLWDFWHDLFQESKERKAAAKQKYYKLQENDRQSCFEQICAEFIFWVCKQGIANEMSDVNYDQIKHLVGSKGFVKYCRSFLDELDHKEVRTYAGLTKVYSKYNKPRQHDLQAQYNQKVQDAGSYPIAEAMARRMHNRGGL